LLNHRRFPAPVKDPTRYLDDCHAAGLLRRRAVVESPTGVEQRVDGEILLTFCSNDYLGLAGDARVAAALARGAARHGAGAGASHLVSGHHRAHHELEAELAEFVNADRALLFSTGYMANLAVVSAFCDRTDTIYEDRLNHASLIDAARLSRARTHRYPHNDPASLAARLEKDRPAGGMIVTDALFSMDGDLAPLGELRQLAERSGLWLLADDAHGLGVLGPGGRGSFAHLGVAPGSRTLRVGTLGKAFGVFGAFVAGDAEAIETLVQSARTYIYTTALPPAVAEALRESLSIVKTADDRRAALFERVRKFRDGARSLGLPLLASETPIQGLVLGDVDRTVAASEHLRRRGIWVPAIRPPTVPEGGARLRITFSSAHTREQVERLLAALAALPREMG
jgi:8-amino-7-oxononanoate synthase